MYFGSGVFCFSRKYKPERNAKITQEQYPHCHNDTNANLVKSKCIWCRLFHFVTRTKHTKDSIVIGNYKYSPIVNLKFGALCSRTSFNEPFCNRAVKMSHCADLKSVPHVGWFEFRSVGPLLICVPLCCPYAVASLLPMASGIIFLHQEVHP